MEPSVLPVNDFEEVQEVTDKKYCSRIAVLLLQQRQKKKNHLELFLYFRNIRIHPCQRDAISMV